MGFLKSWIKQGVGLAGKHLLNTANAYTGGLAGKIGSDALNYANKNSGLIGKALSTIGKSVFNDEARNKMSSLADKALKYIPDGKIKDTLTKINDSAQGRQTNNTLTKPNPIQTVERQKRKSS